MTRSTTVAQAVEPPRGRGIVLITGFEPFGDLNHNPSAAVLDRLPSTIDGRPVVTEILPVATRSIKAAIDALPFGRADLVLLTGVALDRSLISIERVALNLLDFPRPDNQGEVVEEQTIEDEAPLALAARLPVRAIQRAWSEADIPGQVSTTAGTYLCNQAYFTALHRGDYLGPLGFIHLAPDELLAKGGARAYQPLDVAARAIVIAAEVALSRSWR